MSVSDGAVVKAAGTTEDARPRLSKTLVVNSRSTIHFFSLFFFKKKRREHG